MRWLHEGIDRLHVAVTSQLVPAVFRCGTVSPSLHEHLEAVRLQVPPFTAARRYRLTAQTLAGSMEAGFQVWRRPQADLPVIVYHHGIGEMPYDKTFRGIFRPRRWQGAHLVAIQAPFHRSWLHLLPALKTLHRFLAMCAVSLQLLEMLRVHLCQAGAGASLIVGTSLGGFLALLHQMTYGTADRYVPLLAGPDLAHVMLRTPYRRFMAPEALAQPERLRARLDFRRAFQASQPVTVRPVLGRYDRDMLYEHHYACYAAAHLPVVSIGRGHITGALAFTALRTHVLRVLRELTSA